MKFRFGIKDMLASALLFGIGVGGICCLFRSHDTSPTAFFAILFQSIAAIGAGIGAFFRRYWQGALIALAIAILSAPLFLPHVE
jgi:hypothetical protein